MPEIRVDPASLTALAHDMRALASRTDLARRTAIGVADWDTSVIVDAALTDEVDWFYRRAVRGIEALRDLMEGQALVVDGSLETYTWTDSAIGRAADPGPPGRMRRSA